ncbi:DNAJB8 [Symbiodinium sp. CCMP2592]|nr:DNAJB8 [Symbiodinium sp. CCMP2592]
MLEHQQSKQAPKNPTVDGGNGSFLPMFDFDEIEEKLQQQAAASDPVHAPSIDGEWEDNDGTVVIIKNRRMRGPDGVEVEVTFPRPDAVVFTPSPGAPSFEGKLTASDRISWDDGASWVRRPLSAKAQTDQNGSGTKASKAGTPVHQTKTLGEKENLATKATFPEKPNSKLHDSGSAPIPRQLPRVEPKSTARIPPRVDKSASTSKPSSGSCSSRPATSDKKVTTNGGGEAARDSAWHYERFEVMKPVVFVRESPGLNTAKVAQVTRGCVVSGRVQETGWLCLDQDSRTSANVPEHAKGAYMLIDGRNHGLGILLESRGCQGSSKGSFASPLEFVALRNLQVRARPSLSSASTGHVAEGSQVQGYPGAESWLELEGGGFLPIVDKTASADSESKDCLQLQSALQAVVPQTFAEAVVARWEPLPAAAATRVEYSLEWQDAQEPDRHGRVSFSRKCQAHVRSLPPSTTIQVRVVSRLFAPLPGGNPGAKGKEDPASRSWQDHRLVGRWLYGAKPSEYRIGRRSDGLLVFMGPHASGATVMGVLEPEGHWLQAELASASGDTVGHIRLFYDEEEDAVISNFKNIQNVDWGRDIAAKKGGDEEILTTVVGRWVQARTAAAITDQDEEEFCYDSFCNKRGKCQRCPCQIFVLSEHLRNQEMLCRRCGCAAIHHAKVGKFRFHDGQKGKDSEDASSTARPPQKTAMDEIPSRRWSLDDATAGEEIVEFIIRQLELAKNLYEVLGVAPSSSALEIRQAYRAISLRVHPDKINAQAQGEDEQSQSLSALAEDAFKLASSAYEVLNDEIERRSYDRQLYLDWVRTEKPKAKPKPKPKARHAANAPTAVCKKPQPTAPAKGVWDTEGEDGKDPGRRVDEFFKNPTIGTFMNSPYYGEDGVFGSSGTIKENPAGGFSFELPGGGGIHIDNGNGPLSTLYMISATPRPQCPCIRVVPAVPETFSAVAGYLSYLVKQMEEDFAKTGHVPLRPRKTGLRETGFITSALQNYHRQLSQTRATNADEIDNEPVPEKSTLDWLNLNALAPKAIQGAIDRIRHNTLASSGDAEVPKEMDGELLTSPRGKGSDQSAGSMAGYARPARKSLSSALRARGGISRQAAAGTEPESAEGPTELAADGPSDGASSPPAEVALVEPQPHEAEASPVEAAAPTAPEEAEEAEAVPEQSEEPSEGAEAAFAQPTADRTASAPLPVLHEEEEEESTIAAAMPVQVEQPDERAVPDALDGLEEAEELPDRQEVPAELKESEEVEEVQTDSVVALFGCFIDDHAKDSELQKPKDWQEPTTRLPMPTPLMAATASARRAAPPSVVEAPKMEEAQQEPGGKPLLAPEPHLRVQTRDVGKLKEGGLPCCMQELREFWGNKSSKGFAGPGLTGSRLSKNEAQATLQRLLIAGGDFDEVRKLRKIIAELDST